jgi:hypothetical protein
MKNLMKLCLAGVVLTGMLLAARPAHAWLVYDNSANDLLARFNPGTVEVGDEIILFNPNNATYLTNFDFQYYGEGSSGNEMLQVRFYANDGPGGAPGTVLFDSGAFSVTTTPRATLIFDESLLWYNGDRVYVPNVFTWTVEFSGTTDSGESWGVDLYSPQDVGNNYTSYWDNDPVNGWLLKTNQFGVNMDFGARVWAVPEPSGIALGLAGAFLVLLFRSGLRKQ